MRVESLTAGCGGQKRGNFSQSECFRPTFALIHRAAIRCGLSYKPPLDRPVSTAIPAGRTIEWDFIS
jgi:hypothetical protein